MAADPTRSPRTRTLPLEKVVSADRATFYDSTTEDIRGYERPVRRSSLYYSQSYALVHLLLSEPSARKRLRDYIRDLAEPDANTAEVTRRYFNANVCRKLEQGNEPRLLHTIRGVGYILREPQ